MAGRFTDSQWDAIHALLDARGEAFGLPQRRADSLVLGSFNVRKLGNRGRKSEGAWRFLGRVCERFDLLAVQEVQDDLDGLRHLRTDRLGDAYGLVASDITGALPGGRPAPERLAFLYRRAAVERTEVASDITYDRSAVLDTLYGSRMDFWRAFDDYTTRRAAWKAQSEERRRAGKKPRQGPAMRLPRFLGFIRQPLCVSFRLPRDAADPYELLAVNAHLLYGRYKRERWMEFEALMAWLLARARQVDRLYHPNLMLMGDLNLDFRKVDPRRAAVEGLIKGLNGGDLAATPVEVNFPFLSVHPRRTEVFRSNARLSETYDQIAFLAHERERRLPRPAANATAGSPGGYDYGVFDFVGLFREALGLPALDAMTATQRRAFLGAFEHDLSDHMPIWVRLPRPA